MDEIGVSLPTKVTFLISYMIWLELHQYSIEDHDYPKDRGYLLSLLDQYERERFERYKFDHSKWLFATARWLVKQNLSKHLTQSPADIRLSYNPNGKPYIEHRSAVHFSLSHTEKSIALAISNTEIGVDIELMDRRGDPWHSAEAFLNGYVAPVINAITDEEKKKRCFCRYWTGMEARVKVKGESLFTVKEEFGKQLAPMEYDGTYSDGEYIYYSHETDTRQQLSLCIGDKVSELACFSNTEEGSRPDNAMNRKFSANT